LIQKYDMNSGRLTNIIDQEIGAELQKTLEGTEE
jgi:hypothetical protein